MEEKKKNCKEWIREHNVELIIAGIGIGVTIAVILGMKKSASEKILADMSTNFIEKMPEEAQSIEVPIVTETIKNAMKRAPHEVRMHVRNLSKGQPSLEKLAEAERLGISLLSTQTLVDGYRTGENAA